MKIFITGDLFSPEALRSGMQGCDWVFHLAAFTRPEPEDRDLPFRTIDWLQRKYRKHEK
jgi:nucleoside-diphosphate-sugar epimerase